MPEPAREQPRVDDIDAAVEEAIALCGGDPRAAIKALIVSNEFLERELALCRVAMSSGFSRQWHHKRWKIEQVDDGPAT